MEYLVVAVALTVALLAPVPNNDPEDNRNVVEILVDTIKQEYRAYKYANSVNTLPLP